LADSAVGRRISQITGWIVSFFRFLWTIPKALLDGDSRSMIEALGDFLSRTSPPAQSEDSQDPPAKSVPESPARSSVIGDPSPRHS
jgi:hypothetical protein